MNRTEFTHHQQRRKATIPAFLFLMARPKPILNTKNMKIQSLLLAAVMTPAGAFAQQTITFQGEVSEQTCNVTVNGATNSVVLLPTVPASSLKSAGDTAGLTPFTVSVSDCAELTSGNLKINTKFIGYNVTSKGNLGNAAQAGKAGNVAIQLTGSADGLNPIRLNGVTSVPGLVLESGQTSASYQFGAQYISEDGGATAGAVTGIAEYTLHYL